MMASPHRIRKIKMALPLNNQHILQQHEKKKKGVETHERKASGGSVAHQIFAYAASMHQAHRRTSASGGATRPRTANEHQHVISEKCSWKAAASARCVAPARGINAIIGRHQCAGISMAGHTRRSISSKKNGEGRNALPLRMRALSAHLFAPAAASDRRAAPLCCAFYALRISGAGDIVARVAAAGAKRRK